MYSLSVYVFRHLKNFKRFEAVVRQKPLCQTYKKSVRNVAVKKVKPPETLSEEDECSELFWGEDSEVKPSHLTEAVKLMNKYPSPEAVQWEEVIKGLTAVNANSPRKIIILTCVRLEKLDMGVSYYKYLTKKEESLNGVELLFFTKLLAQSPDELPKFPEVVEDFYDKIKDYLFSSRLVKDFALNIFLRFPNCFWDCVKLARECEHRKSNQGIVRRAFEMDEPEVGWEFTKDQDFTPNTNFLKTYLDYCTRMAAKGKFSVNMINDLVKLCYEKMSCLSVKNLPLEMEQLVEAVKNNGNDHSLLVKTCRMRERNVCSNCGLKLNDMRLSNEEFETLKDYFFNNVINDRHIFLHSSEAEVNNFKCFLENCEPFNIVMDGLNMIYMGKSFGARVYGHILKYFLEKNLKILIISRSHSQSVVKKPLYLKHKNYINNVQFFFTSNASDDDLFTIYSAMHGGPDTCFCTGDHFLPYKAKLLPDIQILYHKWKITHQYLLKNDHTLLAPWTHMGVPQLTATPNKRNDCYTWHIPYGFDDPKIDRVRPYEWACVRAVPKKSLNKFHQISFY